MTPLYQGRMLCASFRIYRPASLPLGPASIARQLSAVAGF